MAHLCYCKQKAHIDPPDFICIHKDLESCWQTLIHALSVKQARRQHEMLDFLK